MPMRKGNREHTRFQSSFDTISDRIRRQARRILTIFTDHGDRTSSPRTHKHYKITETEHDPVILWRQDRHSVPIGSDEIVKNIISQKTFNFQRCISQFACAVPKKGVSERGKSRRTIRDSIFFACFLSARGANQPRDADPGL